MSLTTPPRHGPNSTFRDEASQTHRLILAQSPLWILSILLVMQTGILRIWSDADYLLFSFLVASPSVLLPALLTSSQKPWWQTYWFKLNVWIAMLVFFGTYLGTAYFFDLMGMRYAFDVKWALSSDIIGQDRQAVPVFMYPLTHAYFMSYFTGLMVLEGWIVKTLGVKGSGRWVVVLGLAYGLAFAETWVMASPLLEDLFLYKDRERMLRLGSLGYASYFVVGLPMVSRIDGSWSLGTVVKDALAASMAVLLLLEAWAKVVGPL
ncbi:hypothetical protein OQA88_2992 [Cercophora sp. LCS_1]